MNNGKLYLPVNVYGEDVIIDYHNRHLVFPNRQEDNEIDFAKSANISIYLNEEGFLDFESEPTSPVLGGCDLPVNLEPSPSDSPVEALKKTETATVSYAKAIGLLCTLVGLDWGSSAAPGRKTGDFDLDSLGGVEAFGTERQKRQYGWAIYHDFKGEVGAKIVLRNSIKQQEDNPGRE